MKKILLATTVLALTAPLAFAEGVTFSGYGRFGLDYNSDVSAGESETQINMRMRVNINAAVETDSGITFGGRIRLQYTDGDEGAGSSDGAANLSPAKLYAEAAGFRLEVGNVDTAYDSAALMYDSEIGYLDRSFGDPNGDFLGFASTNYDGDDDRMGIFASYSVGDLNVRMSYVQEDQTSTSTDAETSISIDYSTGPFTISAAYVDDAAFDTDAEALFVGAAYAIGDNANVGILYFDYDEQFTADDSTRITLYGNYNFGATTVKGYVATDDQDGLATDVAFGIGADYDLGGARLSGDIHSNYDEETVAGIGVRFDF